MAQSFDLVSEFHAGFGACADAATARRQMKVSIGVVAVLAFAIALTTAVIAPPCVWSASVVKPLQAQVYPKNGVDWRDHGMSQAGSSDS